MGNAEGGILEYRGRKTQVQGYRPIVLRFYVKKTKNKIQTNHNNQNTNNKQITMTKIQNSKQLVFDLI